MMITPRYGLNYKRLLFCHSTTAHITPNIEKNKITTIKLYLKGAYETFSVK